MDNRYIKLKKILQYSIEHANLNLNAELLATQLGMDTNALESEFVDWIGIPIDKFIAGNSIFALQKRLEKAEEQMEGKEEAPLKSLGLILNTIEEGSDEDRNFNMSIEYGYCSTLLGLLFVARCKVGIIAIEFCDDDGRDAIQRLQRRWADAVLERDDGVAEQVYEVIYHQTVSGLSPQKSLSLFLKGTPFQIAVWRGLLTIPKGSLSSYSLLSQTIGKPSAVRAVASAVGKNPISVLIPCHRVIRKEGALGQYMWGSVRKAILVAYERE